MGVDRETTLRRLLFVPCESREALRDWVRVYLGLHLPDCTVSEESNSNPLDLIWAVYDAMRRNTGEYSRIMAYANRGGMKTLGASILEVLTVLHLGRNVAHMAAIFDQSKKSAEYVKGFFNRPVLRDFVVGDNAKEVKVVHYRHQRTGDNIPEDYWNKLAETEKKTYDRLENYIRIVLCTMQSANSQHVEFFCVDGGTRILTKFDGPGNRHRKRYTARGLFRFLDGKNPGGRTGGETPKQIVPRETVELQSLDWETGSLVFRPVTLAVRRRAKRRLIRTDGRELRCSDNHPLWVVGKGFTSEVSVGDRVVVAKKHKTGGRDLIRGRKYAEHKAGPAIPVDEDEWDQVLLGSLLGDGGVYKKPMNNPCYQEQHGQAQAEYLRWKAGILGRHLRIVPKKAVSGYTGLDLVGVRSGNTPLLLPYVRVRSHLEGVERLGPLGLAVWYQDDGCKTNGFMIASHSFTKTQNQKLVRLLRDKFGIESWVEEDPRGKGYYIRGGVDAKRRLVEIVGDFVHPDLAYKFDLSGNHKNCKFCGQKFWHIDTSLGGITCRDPMCLVLQAKKLAIETVTAVESLGEDWVYDFTVDGSNNFFANGLLSKNCIDEVDVVPKQNVAAYRQAGAIPDPRDGMLPITLLTSTRKSRVGLVQKEIDAATETNLQIYHWNVIDTTEKCPSSRHHPEQPRQTLYINDDDVRHITVSDYELLSPMEQRRFYAREAFAGCVKCPLFAACKGRLATHQTSVSPMLKPIKDVANKFKSSPPEFITTEFLCRKPDATGLIYSRFLRGTHMKTPGEIAAIMAGEVRPEVTDKQSLIRFMRERGVQFVAGMDFGFSHNFAVVLFAVWGQYAFILEVIAIPGLELDEKISHCEYLNEVYDHPIIFGDPEAPADIKTFKRKGFRMKEWDKYKGSVKAGIEVVRMMLWPSTGLPRLFLLKDDPGCDYLASAIENYHFTMGATGEVTEEPDKEEDDELDAMRYGVMNAFAPKGNLKAVLLDANPAPASDQALPLVNAPGQPQQWMRDLVKSHVDPGESPQTQATKTLKRGKFQWDG